MSNDNDGFIPILPQTFDAEEQVLPLGYVSLSDRLQEVLLGDGFPWVIAPSSMLQAVGEKRPGAITSFGVFARDAAAPQPIPVERDGTNHMFTLDDLPLDDMQKVLVLEWFARKLWVMLEEGGGEPDYYGKGYDPLVIDLEGKEAHSYVFDLDDGGRHHPFESLLELEEKLKQEGIKRIKEMLAAGG